MKTPTSGTLLVIGFVLVAIAAIALNVYVNDGEGSLRPANDPKKASPKGTAEILKGGSQPPGDSP